MTSPLPATEFIQWRAVVAQRNAEKAAFKARYYLLDQGNLSLAILMQDAARCHALDARFLMGLEDAA